MIVAGSSFGAMAIVSYAFHSITPSARASSVGGTTSPSDLAALRLMTSSRVVGCITGRSDGFAPARTRPA